VTVVSDECGVEVYPALTTETPMSTREGGYIPCLL
jgi:hypothetical protein